LSRISCKKLLINSLFANLQQTLRYFEIHSLLRSYRYVKIPTFGHFGHFLLSVIAMIGVGGRLKKLIG